MPKFDMGAAWEDSMLLLRSHSALTGAIAAVFLFLPTLAVSWFGPVPIEPAAGASFDQVMATMRANVIQAVPYQLFVAIVSGIGGIGILRLWLSRSGISVGEALVFALTMVPTVIVILLMFITAVLTALGVVREKELGSITNLYVTPVNRLEFLLGKQLPYVAVGLANFLLMTPLLSRCSAFP